MKHIVWTRIDDRLIHGQVMTQWIQYTENISVSEEEKEAFRNLLNKGINVFLRVIVTEPEEDIAKYL